MVITVVVECRARIDPTGNPIVEEEVDVTTHVKTCRAVILTLTHFQKVVGMIDTDKGIELGKLTTADKLCLSLIFHRLLLQIIIRIEVDVGITEWIASGSIVIDILVGEGKFPTVVGTCLVVEGHVFSRAEIFLITLGHAHGDVATHVDLETIHVAALGRDKDHAF